jgi:hypothetical protein
MSSSNDHAAASHGYGSGGRTARPLFALIPLGILIALALAMLAEGISVMITPSNPVAGENSIAQTAVPSAGPGAPTKG